MPGPTIALTRLPWPLPAVLCWAAAWAAFSALRAGGLGAGLALVLATGVGAALALAVDGRWRRLLTAAGFPLSLLALGAAGPVAPAVWIGAAALLLVLYPLRAWRDAPFFPTPAAALAGLPGVVQPAPAHVLDAGCGLGHGLLALRRLWPEAKLAGLEWSAPLAWLAARRLPGVAVRRADMWQASWAGHDLVYLFQRPESMARAWTKAQAELAPGAWLVSLEFEVPGVAPVARLEGAGRPVWVYRVGGAKAVAGATDGAPAAGFSRSTGRPAGR